MIELTSEQRQALLQSGDGPVRVIDPSTNRAFVLLREEEYERLKDEEYDASPWTDEELALLAAEQADFLGWEGMEAYQDDEP
jgi:hypothetical protein